MLVVVLIPAATSTPAALPQLAAIDIYFKLNSKNFTKLFNRHKTKTYFNYNTKAVLGLGFSNLFCLKRPLK